MESLRAMAVSARQEVREHQAAREDAVAELSRLRRDSTMIGSQVKAKLASALRQRAAMEKQVDALRDKLSRRGVPVSVPGPTPTAKRTRAAIHAMRASAELGRSAQRSGRGWK